MPSIAVKAAASRDCSGNPFLCAGKRQGGKKIVAESPKPMLIEILVMMLLIKLRAIKFIYRYLLFIFHSYGVLLITSIMFLLIFRSYGAVVIKKPFKIN
jgi:hypothetical protein